MQIEYEPEDSKMYSCLCEEPDKAVKDELGVWIYEKAWFHGEVKKVPTASSPKCPKHKTLRKHAFEFLSTRQVSALEWDMLMIIVWIEQAMTS